VRRSHCHSGAQGEKSVGGGPSPTSPGPHQARSWVRLAQRAHSSSCTSAMKWISASWRYIMSTLLVVGGGKELGVMAAAASV
jgi:hypothetical protein